MKYKIIVDKQPRTNPSNEKKEYEIDIEELRFKGNVYDSLIITKDEDYVMRRLSLSEYHVLSVLDEPIKEPLENINIELFEGDNYIYLMDMAGNKFYAEYLVKNEFNDIYVTEQRLTSAITQTAGQIELSVNQTLNDRFTGAKIMMAINGDESEIQIDADKIDIVGKKVKFKTNIEAEYTFSQSDLNTVQQFLLGNITLNNIQKEFYDVNKDGIINSADLLKIQKAIMLDEGKYVVRGTLEINPDSAERSIILRDEDGNIITSIGLLGMQTDSFSTNELYSNNANIYNLKIGEMIVKNEIENLKERISKLEGGNK